MGRHGGGSRSGGSSRSSSRSGGGSRSGGSSGSSVKTSKTPFAGSYNRSYYDRRGRYHAVYTTNRFFGTERGFTVGRIIALLFVTLHFIGMSAGMCGTFVTFGSKVDGDPERILIVDTIDALTPEEEEDVYSLLHEVYDKSGMPVTVYTMDFEWKNFYSSLEVLSEELYYKMGYDEDAMIILFTAGETNGYYDWVYDIYCGDETINCLSDPAFDRLVNNFQKGMAGQSLYQALNFTWDSVMDDLAETSIDGVIIIPLLFLIPFYIPFFVSIVGDIVKNEEAYKYFKEHPEELVGYKTTTLYNKCPSCNASNSSQSEICPYCNTLLKVSDKKTTFVSPNE